MSESDPIVTLLNRIEENQRKALEVQQQQLALAREQFERSGRSIAEGLELQRASVSRQSLVTRIVVPVIGILLLLLGYLLVKWHVL